MRSIFFFLSVILIAAYGQVNAPATLAHVEDDTLHIHLDSKEDAKLRKKFRELSGKKAKVVKEETSESDELINSPPDDPASSHDCVEHHH